jgi:tellurite resistance protein TerC
MHLSTIAGVSWVWWVGFHVAAAVILTLDGLLTSKGGTKHKQFIAALSTAGLIAAAGLFAVWMNFAHGHQSALEFVAGYTVELSLSIDNLFVFLVLFDGFGIGERRQRKALLWGVGGAIVLRACFIGFGIALINRFHWISWIFGLVLLWAAFRLVRGGSAEDALPGWVRGLQAGSKRGSLLTVIIAVELTDLLFAVDSIPAVLAISHNPFVVYTSNIAAILGLRSLYFALRSLLDRLEYLHYGLGVLLGFVALKMLAAPWIELPITLSLIIMGLILAVCAVLSLQFSKQNSRA